MIPRFKPWLGRAEFEVLFRRSDGAVEQFEQEFARALGAADAVAFPHGRSALWAFLKAMGISEAGVVMPAYTCSVVAHAISLSGNRPRFVDIRLDDYNMDLESLSSAITEDTRAVIATHLFGYPLDLDRLEAIVADAERRFGHKVWIIQDCAHSFGASWKQRLVGSSGDVALYGLNISKMVTSIFGGMLTFNDRGLAERVRVWRDAHFRHPPYRKALMRRIYLMAAFVAFSEPVYGLTWFLQEKTPLLDRFTKSYHLDNEIHFPPDYLERMLPVEAAVGLSQLRKYPDIIARRRAAAAYYSEHLKRQPEWVMPPLVDGATYSHFVIRVPERAAVVHAVAERGLQLGELIQYSVPELTCYGRDASEFPAAHEASMRTINVPIYPEADVERICAIINGQANDVA